VVGAPKTQVARAYGGPECPRCRMRLTADWLYTGEITCPDCGKTFEATAFSPPERPQPAQIALIALPEEGSGCANHARNAAVTNCQRCGLFICALCDMDIGTGPLCPSCFDRMREEGSLTQVKRGYRDYARLALIALIAGIVFGCGFLGLPFGALSLVYSRKAIQQLHEAGRPRTGAYVVISLAMIESLVGLVWMTFFFYTLFRAGGVK
jgi:hypothetical protein